MIHILKVCVSSKDMGKKGKHIEYKRKNERDPVKKEDVTQHLVAAIVAFIERQLDKEAVSYTHLTLPTILLV